MAFQSCIRLFRLSSRKSFRNWSMLVEFDGSTLCSKSYSSTRMPTMQSTNHSQPKSYLQHEFDYSRAVATTALEAHDNQGTNSHEVSKDHIGENVSRNEKVQFLVSLLSDLKESREAVYGALDAWVAWEQTFPLASLRRALITLEKEQQWHKVVQVIKWMLSKGQGTTMGTYEQLIRALEKDFRAEEAHQFWEKRIGHDLHSVPWHVCRLMLSIYYRNNMLERLIKLFKGLEAFNRKPPAKSIVQQVANTYEILGLVDEQKKVLEKYKDLFVENPEGKHKKQKASKKDKNKKEVGIERREYQSSESSDQELQSVASQEAS